jgi:putative peptide zinc metalloprotease protein
VALFFFFFVPMPVSRVRHTGLVQIQPRHVARVHMEIPARLEKIYVQEGQWVARGAVLAEFSSLELETQRDDAQTHYDIKENEIKMLGVQLAEANRRGLKRDAEKLKAERVAAEQDRDKADKQLRIIRDSLRKQLLSGTPDRMLLKAPRAGYVIHLPPIDEVGKYWDKESPPFCSIGDPTKLRVLVPIPPDNYDLVRHDDKHSRETTGQSLEVTLRVHGRDSRTWHGRLSYFPDSEAHEIPPALSNRAGGPVAVAPGGDANHLVPISQAYLVGIDIDDPDAAICPGVLAQVKIHCEHRTCAWWVWRLLSGTFDIGLL